MRTPTEVWVRAIGRPAFILRVVRVAILIVLLLALALYLELSNYGPEDDVSLPSGLLTSVFLFVAPLLGAVLLAIPARQRLNDLGLSGVWLFVFPIWSIFALRDLIFSYYFPLFREAALLAAIAFAGPLVLLGAACLLSLALLPGTGASGSVGAAWLDTLRRLIETRTLLSRALFGRAVLVGLAVYLGGRYAPPLLQTIIESLTGEHLAFSMTMSLLEGTFGLLSDLALLYLLAVTIRRLRTLGRAIFWAGFFPLGAGWAGAALWQLVYEGNLFLTIDYVVTIVKLPDPFISVPILLDVGAGVGAIPVLIWLLFAPDRGGPAWTRRAGDASRLTEAAQR